MIEARILNWWKVKNWKWGIQNKDKDQISDRVKYNNRRYGENAHDMQVQTGCKGKEMMQNKTYIEKKQQ